MRRYLGGGPGRLRRLELGQLCRAHSDLDLGLVVRSQVFLDGSAHVTARERTPPPHVTGHSSQLPTAHSCPQGTSRLHGTTGLGLRRCLHSTGWSTLSSPDTVRTQRTVRFLKPSDPQVAVHCCQPPTHHLAGQSIFLHFRCPSSGRLSGSHSDSSTTPTSISKQRTGWCCSPMPQVVLQSVHAPCLQV